MVSKNYDCTDKEMEALYNQLAKNTQLQYFEKAIRTGEDLPETGDLPESRDQIPSIPRPAEFPACVFLTIWLPHER